MYYGARNGKTATYKNIVMCYWGIDSKDGDKQDRRWQKRHIWLYLGEDLGLRWLNGKVLTEEDLQRLNGTKC